MFESYSLNVEKTDIIFNVATKEVLKITAENDILNHAKEGELMYDTFVTDSWYQINMESNDQENAENI